MATCIRCNRPLTDKKSIDRGFGPVCCGKIQRVDPSLFESDGTTYLPFDGTVRFSRDENGHKTINIPRTLVKHSPTGLEWGYGGSGPADTALNILFFFTKDEEFSVRHYQDFKWKFVANLPGQGGEIQLSSIQEFIKERQS